LFGDGLSKSTIFTSDFGVTKVGRAITAFTHLLRRRDTTAVGENLLWALLGLEALYTTGQSELGAQLFSKIQLILGKQREFKKAISQMYGYRSRFIHGDIPVPMRYCHYEGLREYESFAQEIDQQNYVAANVLTASLQSLAERNAIDLAFEWSVVEPNKEITV
jgi:hypothetical protein